MCRLVVAVLATALFSAWPRSGAAQDRALTLDGALALARVRAPALLAARARIDEARGRLVGASVWLRDNPVLEGGLGARSTDRGDFFEADVGLVQAFEIGSRRSARIDGAEADVEHTAAASQDVARRLLRDVAWAFYGVLRAVERMQLDATVETVAIELLRVAERRRSAGDAPTFEVDIARAGLARARADVRSAEASHAAALGGLRLLLGLAAEDRVAVTGDLHDRRRFSLDELVARAPRRADLRALEAEVREAEADRRFAGGLAWPDLGAGARYEREEGADVVLGTLSLTLPVFERGSGARAESDARARRLRLEIDGARRVVDAEVRSAFDVYRLRTAAVEEFERDALALLDDNEATARRAYEAGAMALGELLAVRREVLDMRHEHLNRLFEAALAGVELEAAAGLFE